MEQAQPTLAQEIAAPLIMLVLTSVVALIGWLLSRQLKSIDTTLQNHANRIDNLERENLHILITLGLKRPSDVFKKFVPPKEGGHSA